MRAKNLTEPGKKKCSNEDCRADLPNTMFAPRVISDDSGKEICADCKLQESYVKIRQMRNGMNNGASGPRSMEI